MKLRRVHVIIYLVLGFPCVDHGKWINLFFTQTFVYSKLCKFIITNMHDREAQEGLLRKQKLNAHTCAVLLVLGFGSLTYGYTASIIGTTLGKFRLALLLAGLTI